jgi:hypothetical protein
MHAPRQPTSAGFGTGRAYRPRTAIGVVPPPDQVLDYDVVEQVARLTWFDATRKTWFQTYYDDPTTLAPKEHLTVERGLAGIGIWALGDDAGQPGYWETIAATLGLGPPYVAPSPTPSASAGPSASPSGAASPSPSSSPSAAPSRSAAAP